MVEAWSETCYITITPKGTEAAAGTNYEFRALTSSIDIDQGDKPIESIPLVNAGRVTKNNPEENTTITMEAYPIFAGDTSAAAAGTASGFGHLFTGTSDASQPLNLYASTTRNKHRVAVLWTDDTTVTSATSMIATDSANTGIGNAYRYAQSEMQMTSYKQAFTDGVLKITATFNGPPFDKSGVANYAVQSCVSTTATTARLTTLATYYLATTETVTTKGIALDTA